MKFTWIFISLIFLLSCQPQKKQDNEVKSNEITQEKVAVDIEEFKEYFQNINLPTDTFHIHHYRWATDDEAFKGILIAEKILNQYVDSTVFKTNFDEQYYAIAHIEQLQGFLIRVKISEADHMQQLFLLTYDAEKQVFIGWTKVASFFGAEGFINQMASWIVAKDDNYEVFMRNNNWSVDVVKEIETETDSMRTYIFENHQFTPKSTVKTSELLKRQFPLE